jgi:nucleosome assembly protein 1-like 1
VPPRGPACAGQVGATIREKLIPEAVSWYTGEAAEDDGLFLGEGDDDDDEDGEGEDGEGEDE